MNNIDTNGVQRIFLCNVLLKEGQDAKQLSVIFQLNEDGGVKQRRESSREERIIEADERIIAVSSAHNFFLSTADGS